MEKVVLFLSQMHAWLAGKKKKGKKAFNTQAKMAAKPALIFVSFKIWT